MRATAPAMTRTATPWRAAAASTLGSILEYYDFFVYGPLSALVFPVLFFPNNSPGTGTLLALSTYAVGFVARPLGGIVVGRLGDRLGRKRMMVFTFVLAGCATVGMGAMPTYAQIGILAPALLVTLRFVQGVAIGGEWGGAALLTVEHSPEGRRGFFGSLVQAGAPVGVILSNGAVAVLTASLPRAELLAWGWRIPFLASLLLVVVGFVVRVGVAESPVFEAVKEEHAVAKAPVLQTLRKHYRRVLATIGIHVGDTTIGFMQGIFVLGFATGVLKMDATTVLLANITGSVANLIVTPFAGHLGDRLGRRHILLWSFIALGLWAFPMFWLIETRSVAALFLTMIIGSIITGFIFAQQATMFAELYEPQVRYSAVSIGFQVATVIGGGFGPLIAQALQQGAGGSTVPVSAYLVLVAVIGLISTHAITRRARSNS